MAAHKLDRHQIRRRDEAREQYTEALARLMEAVDAFNEESRTIHEALRQTAEACNTAAERYVEVVQEIGEELRGEWDDKSEKWQEGERGQAAADFIASYEDFSIDEFEVPEPATLDVEDEPDPLEDQADG